MIALNQIRIDGGTQSRIELNQDVVAEYAEAYKAGAQMPPVVVFFDGVSFWLADGFHRYFGAKAAGLAEIHEDRQPGTQREAVLFSLGANAKHGLRRCNADKRKAVQTLLDDPEWSTWSDNAVAKACSVSRSIVESLRKSSLAEMQVTTPADRTYTTKHGTTATMNTANIGARSAPDAAAPPAEDEQYSLPKVSELDALREQCAELGHNLKETLAENETLSKVFDANDQAGMAMAEAKRFREMNRILEERIRGLMNEKNEAIRAAKNWMRRAEKAEAALKEAGHAA